MMKKKAYCYKIKLHFLFLTAICHKGGKFQEIRGFSGFFGGYEFSRFQENWIFCGYNFRDFGQKPRKARKLIPPKISTTKVECQTWKIWPGVFSRRSWKFNCGFITILCLELLSVLLELLLVEYPWLPYHFIKRT